MAGFCQRQQHFKGTLADASRSNLSVSVGLNWGVLKALSEAFFHPAERQTEEKHASGHLKGRDSRCEALISPRLPRLDVEPEEGVKSGRDGRGKKWGEAVAKSSLRDIVREAAVE